MDEIEMRTDRLMELCENFLTSIDIDIEWERCQKKIFEKVE